MTTSFRGSQQGYFQRGGRLLVFLFWLLIPANVLVPAALPAWGGQILCADTEIIVVAEKKSEQEWVCLAVQDAIGFLRAINIGISGPLTIQVVDNLPINHDHHAIGQYDPRSNKIHLLNYQATILAASTSPPACGVSVGPALWRSYAIHELAHAVAQQNFSANAPTFTASEYIAAVVQFATLPKSLRKEILQNCDNLSGFVGKTDITALYYFLDPCKFAVNAYLHYLKPENGPSFIHRLLNEGLPE